MRDALTQLARPDYSTPSGLVGAFLRALHVDFPLLMGLLLLSGCGFVILYSASGQNMDLLIRQATRLGLAYGLMFFVAQISPHQLARYSIALFSFGVVLLVAVLVMGDIGKGAQRWLDLGVFRFQPSEILKIATPMLIARYISSAPLPPKTRQLLIAGGLIMLPTLLIAKQPDLGTSLLVATSGAAILFVGGISWAFLIGIVMMVAAAAPLLWFHFMHDYQKNRVLTFLNPEADPMGNGYHIIQSKIAIGSGGIYGKGWLNGTQSHLEFLPERSTDFIFAVFAEEFGLIGCIALLIIYLLIIARGLYIAVQAQDSYGRLLAGGLVLTFFVYVFVNIGMVIGVLPVVGVPLPLVSYGGTSMVTLLAGFGILMSIHTHRKLLPT